MNRSELIEALCNLILTDSAKQSSAELILKDLTSNRISTEEAADRYALITAETSTAYWFNKMKSKVVYDSLKKYLHNELDSIGISKMLSSMITHSIIEIQKNPMVSQSELGIPKLLSLLSASLMEETPDGFDDDLKDFLRNYGYMDEKEGE